MFNRRAVCTAAVAGKRFLATAKHEPPKKLHGVEGRYASALYTAASKVRTITIKS